MLVEQPTSVQWHPEFSSSQMTKRVVVSVHNTLVTQQILSKLIGHGPLKGQKLKLRRAVICHIPLCRSQTPASISNWPHLARLHLRKDGPQAPMTGINLQDKWLSEICIG
ncbi:hypothetical protein GOODEAATRI_027586 [Goodea atripinnis]|uniref:Uncharacterized protein n=1 Tax=Goodea atripinnis TaxID=208336 RepID=A0ABV0P8C1_9TELE